MLHGREIIKAWSSSSPSEIWFVYEQVCIAAFAIHEHEIAELCLKALDSRFKGSSRVKKLWGMRSEARGEWDDAVAIYDSMLATNPTAQVPRRRKIAALKASGRFADALADLVAYTGIYTEDVSGWAELFSLYTQLGRLEQARFAAEELVLLRPDCYLHHVMLADTLYAIGGSQSLFQAKAHYAQALELKKDSLRAAYGLIATLQAMGFTQPHHEQLYALASQIVKDAHATMGGIYQIAVDAVLEYEVDTNASTTATTTTTNASSSSSSTSGSSSSSSSSTGSGKKTEAGKGKSVPRGEPSSPMPTNPTKDIDDTD